MNYLELLAPAKNAEVAIEAVLHGADAVYMGASSHGARSAASNSLDDISRVVDFAHKFNARVYVTVNTLVYDNELGQVERLVKELYRRGVDALIVQDMSLLRIDIPPIALHASTQCDARSPEKARFLEQSGFSQIVLPREFTIEEIREVRKVTTVPLEAFIHGALCVSYSGDCQASCASAGGRSANRGECAQICRLSYTLYDGRGSLLVKDKHLLSLKDLNRSQSLLEMAEAGISSFKIEGRLKDVGYVKNTVAAYRRLLDDIIAGNRDKYARLSCGRSEVAFLPDLAKSYNRGFTDYFGELKDLGSIDTPKWQGEEVGVVTVNRGREINARLTAKINNGDGLAYFDKSGVLHGFRVNRSEGTRLMTVAPEKSLFAGMKLYRNGNKEWEDMLEGQTATRTIGLSLTLRVTENGLLTLEGRDERGGSATVALPFKADLAQKPQEETRKRTLQKTGNTIYRTNEVNDLAGGYFIPLSLLSELRRMCTEALDRGQTARYRYDYRRMENGGARFPSTSPLTYHDNVANRLAREFYKSHGAVVGQPAFETERPKDDGHGTVVMTSKYCIRRQLGRCLKTPEGKKWSGPLTIRSGQNRYRLDFDCKNCRMKVVSF